MELHNDGTYVEEQTDYVLMMKIDEQNMQGGNSCCCISTTGSISTNFPRPAGSPPNALGRAAEQKRQQGCFPPGVRRRFAGPPGNALYRPVRPAEDFEEGTAEPPLRRAGDQQNILSIPVPVGKFLLINNLFWLHGRDRFTPHRTCAAS